MLSSAESKATGTTRIIYGAVYYMAAAVTEDDMASLIYLVHKHTSKFPAEHRLGVLLAGPVQLFFAFSTFFVLQYFRFLIFFVSLFPYFWCSVFVRKASRQQLIRIFPEYTADTQPCDGPPSRPYHF